MAIEYKISIVGQPYFQSQRDRYINVFYTEPEMGCDPDTGILLLISGFEGDAGSRVFQKMRREFSDQKNMIVIQCDYFGIEFMGSKTMSAVHERMKRMSQVINESMADGELFTEEWVETVLELEESGDNFCELGIFQALDNLRAVKAVMEFYKNREITINYNRVLAYGYSHGAYLALLCNAIFPNLFSAIIDNSGWIYPVYLYRPRRCGQKWDNNERMLYVLIQYKGRLWIDDMEIYNLRRHYSEFTNKAKIYSFHGEHDGLVPLNEKKNFIEKINNAQIYVIDKQTVDGRIFRNTKHGMGSDFLALFYYVTSQNDLSREEEINRDSGEILWKSRGFASNKYHYAVSGDIEIFRTKNR